MIVEKENKFIVLTSQRSGSVWVMDTLSSLPHVIAQGELFLRRVRVSEKRWDADFAIPRFIETKPEGIPTRPFTVFSYLNSLYRSSGIVEFKLMYKQLSLYPEILGYLIRHQIRVIHLVRQNHLDVLLSQAFKAEIGQAHLLSGQTAPENIQVKLETEKIVKQLEWLEKKQNMARWLLRRSGLCLMEIAYEELVRTQSNFQQILRFLSIDPEEHTLTSTTVKIRKGEHRDAISNYDEVKDALANSKFANSLH
jgi:LPS sulfotransferase NodH